MSEAVVYCHHVEAHRDMYPEFAPEPIVIACREPAVALFVFDFEDLEGPTTDVLCSKHTFERMTVALEGARDFVARALHTEDRTEYLAGRAHALGQEVSDGQFLVAANTPMWSEAELHSPEYSSELFDVGWAWAMTERVSEWSDRQEHEFQEGWERDADS